ncbi:MAG: hypothetical protein H7A30_02700 [Thermotogae bacterium]|nr:hypothetical protein [Thermotogota bacterium]
MKSIYKILKLSNFELIRFLRNKKFVFIMSFTIFAGIVSIAPDYYPFHIIISSGRGIYNSAWIGIMMAIIINLFLFILGFIIIRHNIEDDRNNGIDVFIDSSEITKNQYILYKHFSKFIILIVISFILIFTSGIMQIIRGEDRNIDIIKLFWPFLISSVPTLYFLASVSVLFEVVKILRRSLGNLILFALWMVYSISIDPQPILDLFGMNYYFRTVFKKSLIIIGNPKIIDKYLVESINYSAEFYVQRLIIIIVSVLCLILSMKFFKGLQSFDVTRKNKFEDLIEKNLFKEKNKNFRFEGIKSIFKMNRIKFNFIEMYKGELRIILKKSYILFILTVFFSILNIERFNITTYYISLFLGMIYISEIGSREYYTGIQKILYSSYNFTLRQFLSLYSASFTVLTFAYSGILIKFLAEGNYRSIVSVFISEIIIISVIYIFGIILRNTNFLEIILFFISYILMECGLRITDEIYKIHGILYLTIIFVLVSFIIRSIQVKLYKK